ncbi:MAG: hypothetical protein A2Y10_03875 [Planctomycetes bacterium GWF2_41_51]|nr:MAG: hypothetical protein A2Y10_03875 [Planctomycetes bacterium GWF2_41_51]
MDRRHFLKQIGTYTLGAQLCMGAVASALAKNRAKQPPNVVFILVDDLGWGDLGCYGNRNIKTPNIDRLAKQGLLFTHYYTSSPVCSPTRASLITGRFPSTLGIHCAMDHQKWNAQYGMPDYLDPQLSLLKLLQSDGYSVGHFGKWHLGVPYNPGTPTPKEYGIDEYATLATDPWPDYRRPGAYRSEWAQNNIDAAITFIEKHPKEPFYLNVWLYDVHCTLDPSDEQMEPYKDRWKPLPSHADKNRVPMHRDHKGAIQIYSAAVTNVDTQVGRLIDKLNHLGLSENTIIVFSSDNGQCKMSPTCAHSAAGSAGPFRGCKGSLYEGGTRVPFIIRWPEKIPAGIVDDTTIISSVDFLPSVCSIAEIGIPKKTKLDGEDMSSALLGKPKKRTRPLMWEFRYNPTGAGILDCSPMLAMREGKWKLLMNPDRSRVELYDIIKDVSEVDNVAEANKKVVAEMSLSLLTWHKSLPSKDKIPPRAGKNAYPWPKSGKIKKNKNL